LDFRQVLLGVRNGASFLVKLSLMADENEWLLGVNLKESLLLIDDILNLLCVRILVVNPS
jgi:hypothetical protein